MKKKTKIVEGFEGEILHPSLDIKDDILSLGFRYHAKSGKDETFVLIADSGIVEIIHGSEYKAINEKNYFIEIGRNRRLMNINTRWSLDDLNQCVEEWENLNVPPPNPNKLYQSVVETLKRYIELEEEIDYTLIAAWVVGTYFYPSFSAYPFIHAKAMKGSGKSQFLDLLRQLCFNAIKAHPTTASLGDTVDALRGTFLIDQADSLHHPNSGQLLNLLTDSYKKGGGKRRVTSMDKGKRDVDEFDVYGPKVFASIKELPEDLRDRCLVIRLMRSKKNFSDPNEDNDSWLQLRSSLYRFLIGNYSDVANEYILRRAVYKQNNEIVGRPLELWLPFETMLRRLEVGNETIATGKKRFLSQYDYTESEIGELEIAVIDAVLEKIGAGESIILGPKEIAEGLEDDDFRDDQRNPNQRSVAVGWAIKKTNISSQKCARKKGGMSYLFEKIKVERIRNAYFPTLPASEVITPENILENSDVGNGVGL